MSGPGRQRERTVLAWRRTGLATAATGLAALKVLPDTLGAAGLALAVCALVGGVTIVLTATRQARATLAGAASDGALLLGVALTLAACSALALVAVLCR